MEYEEIKAAAVGGWRVWGGGQRQKDCLSLPEDKWEHGARGCVCARFRLLRATSAPAYRPPTLGLRQRPPMAAPAASAAIAPPHPPPSGSLPDRRKATERGITAAISPSYHRRGTCRQESADRFEEPNLTVKYYHDSVKNAADWKHLLPIRPRVFPVFFIRLLSCQGQTTCGTTAPSRASTSATGLGQV